MRYQRKQETVEAVLVTFFNGQECIEFVEGKKIYHKNASLTERNVRLNQCNGCYLIHFEDIVLCYTAEQFEAKYEPVTDPQELDVEAEVQAFIKSLAPCYMWETISDADVWEVDDIKTAFREYLKGKQDHGASCTDAPSKPFDQRDYYTDTDMLADEFLEKMANSGADEKTISNVKNVLDKIENTGWYCKETEKCYSCSPMTMLNRHIAGGGGFEDNLTHDKCKGCTDAPSNVGCEKQCKVCSWDMEQRLENSGKEKEWLS